jgi:hypothetical protein
VLRREKNPLQIKRGEDDQGYLLYGKSSKMTKEAQSRETEYRIVYKDNETGVLETIAVLAVNIEAALLEAERSLQLDETPSWYTIISAEMAISS